MAQEKVAIYFRVSTEDQAENGFSLRDQENRLRKYCRDNNLEIVASYQEDHSAKDFNRPKFKQFLADVKTKQIKPTVLLCVRMDRFSRNLEESLTMIKTLKGLGIKLKTIENDVNLDQPENLIPFILNMVLPQVENERRGMNTKRGMRQAKREGRWVGSAPKGYSFMQIDNKPMLVPNNQAKFVIKGFQEVAKGLVSSDHVRFFLRKEGFICSKNQFYNILRNPVYTGKIVLDSYRDEPQEIIQGLHKPLISEDLFEQVQAVLEGRKKKVPKSSCYNEFLPLRGYLICQRCGSALTGSGSLNRAKVKYYYYHCQHGCRERFRADEAEEKLIRFFSELKAPDEVMDLYKEVMKDLLKEDDKGKDAQIKGIDEELKKYKERLETLQDKFFDNRIDDETFESTRQRYKEQAANLQERKKELNSADSEYLTYLNFGFSFIKGLPRFYRDSSLEVKHKILGSIFPKKIIYQEKNYRTTQVNEIYKIFSLKIKDLEGLEKAKATPKSGLYYRAPPLGLEPRTP